MKKQTLHTCLTLLIIVCFALAFTACGANNNSPNEGTEAKQTQTYTDSDGKTREDLNKSEDSFLGTWVGTSSSAENLYGSITLTINEDNTFDADVTDEIFSGTWEKIDGGIHFDSIYISGEMYFGEKCRMVIYEDDVAPVVLKKVED